MTERSERGRVWTRCDKTKLKKQKTKKKKTTVWANAHRSGVKGEGNKQPGRDAKWGKVFWKTVHVNITLSLSQKTRGKYKASHRFTVRAPAHRATACPRCRRGNNWNHINNNRSERTTTKWEVQTGKGSKTPLIFFSFLFFNSAVPTERKGLKHLYHSLYSYTVHLSDHVSNPRATRAFLINTNRLHCPVNTKRRSIGLFISRNRTHR